MATRRVTKARPLTPNAEARMKRPMTRAEVHALMQSQMTIMLGAMNELEGRIQALEQGGVHTSPGGIVLLDGNGRAQ